MAKGKKFEAVAVLGKAIREAIDDCCMKHRELKKMSELDYYEALTDALDGELSCANARLGELQDEEEAGKVDEDEG